MLQTHPSNMATWTNESENSATFTNVSESKGAVTISIGESIGLLLVLTYAENQVDAIAWSNVSENSASWTNVTES